MNVFEKKKNNFSCPIIFSVHLKTFKYTGFAQYIWFYLTLDNGLYRVDGIHLHCHLWKSYAIIRRQI